MCVGMPSLSFGWIETTFTPIRSLLRGHGGIGHGMAALQAVMACLRLAKREMAISKVASPPGEGEIKRGKKSEPEITHCG
jgi:hypothetical protein